MRRGMAASGRRARGVRWMLFGLVCLWCVVVAAEAPSGDQESVQEQPNSESQEPREGIGIVMTDAQERSHSDETPYGEPVVAYEITTSDFDGDVKWQRVETSDTTPRTVSEAERQEFVERMQATLDVLLQRFEAQGMHVLESEQQTIAELKQLIEEAAPVLTPELLQELPELYEQFVDAQTLPDSTTDDGDAFTASTADDAESPPVISAAEPTDAFLDLEDRIHAEGLSDELVKALRVLADEENDLFAHETLAFIEFFEPNATHNRDFSSAFRHLRAAADAGLSVASSVLAMLSLIDFGIPRNVSLPVDERHELAKEWLLDLAREQDFTASMVVGYRMLTGEMQGLWTTDACQNAVRYYHRCAESNIQQMADMGGERGYDMMRLSEEYMAPGLFHEELLDDPVQRFEYFRSVAANPMDEQWVEATHRLGEMYYFGDDAAGVRQDFVRATEHFRRAAEAGEPLAQANYGMMLAQGIGVKQDNATALKYFKMAAAQGSGFALHGIGVLYLTGGGVPKNETRALLYFQKAVEFGYIESHTYIGLAYLHGRGVEINETKAFDHFTEAATTDSSRALFNLGVMHYRGAGTKQSCHSALEYFRRVATHPGLLTDLPFSMDRAYDCYKKGDYVRAYLQYRLLSEFGSEEAQTNAAFLLEQHGESILGVEPSLWMGSKRPLAEALHLYEQAAALNDTEAIRKTGACHYEGWDGVCDKNLTKAMEQYEKAAKLGDAEAAYNCGAMYTSGEGVGRDLDAAKRFFTMCSDAYFPENVPCAVALVGLNAVVAVRSLVDKLSTVVPLL